MAEPSEGLVAPSQEVAPRAPGWPLVERIGFRFLFCYFVLYAFPFPVGSLPWTEKAGRAVRRAARPDCALGRAEHPRHRLLVRQRVSRQRRSHVRLRAASSAAGAGDRRDRDLVAHRPARAASRPAARGAALYVRVYLATTMLGYGFAKIFAGQFQPPGPYLLDEDLWRLLADGPAVDLHGVLPARTRCSPASWRRSPARSSSSGAPPPSAPCFCSRSWATWCC